MTKRFCKTCGKKFFVSQNWKKRGFYCSQKCYGISKQGKPAWNKGMKGRCFNTGRTHFKKGMIPKTHFRKGHIPWNKDKKFPMEKCVNWKGGKIIDKRGYISIKIPNHPFARSNGYVFEHRLVMEKHLGRYLKKTEHIHHIDRNRANNKLENLMYFPNNSAHVKYHHLMDK